MATESTRVKSEAGEQVDSTQVYQITSLGVRFIAACCPPTSHREAEKR